MLHVRVVSPAELTGRLLTELAGHSGVRNLVVLAGAAQRPDGDAIQFDLLNASANPVLHQLRRLDLDNVGSVTVGQVNVVLDGPPSPADERRYARREQVPVWEMVEGTIRANASYPPSFYLLLIIAGLIAAVGILTNSQILIVGAMVVGPEYFAIIATALGLTTMDRGRRDWTAVRVSLRALGYGFLAAIAATFLFGLAVRGAGQVPASYQHGVRPVAELINSPDIYSVIVAVLAWPGRRGVADRVPGQRADRGVHLGHHDPGGRVHRAVARVRELARCPGLGGAVAAERRPADRGGRGRAEHPAVHLEPDVRPAGHRIAIGLTGEPVPACSRSGATTHMNDQRPACSHAGTSSAKSR